MRRLRSLLLVPFSFLASSLGARRRKPTNEDSPAGDKSRGTGEDQLVPPSFLPYLLLPLLPQLTTDSRNRPPTTEIDCRRSILTVSPGSGRSAYRYPVGLVHTARTKRHGILLLVVLACLFKGKLAYSHVFLSTTFVHNLPNTFIAQANCQIITYPWIDFLFSSLLFLLIVLFLPTNPKFT
ncbi:hypothetical protein BHE74_00035045 [Ensete ventricosum]|nr:hypothetical protein BHE74_00035045 [Ensete ventricosum]